MDEKEPFVKIQLPNIDKDHQIVARPSRTTVDYHELLLSITLWTKF